MCTWMVRKLSWCASCHRFLLDASIYMGSLAFCLFSCMTAYWLTEHLHMIELTVCWHFFIFILRVIVSTYPPLSLSLLWQLLCIPYSLVLAQYLWVGSFCCEFFMLGKQKFSGQPKRHLLTTGWSVFVSTKRLFAGDSVLFIRYVKGILLEESIDLQSQDLNSVLCSGVFFIWLPDFVVQNVELMEPKVERPRF